MKQKDFICCIVVRNLSCLALYCSCIQNISCIHSLSQTAFVSHILFAECIHWHSVPQPPPPPEPQPQRICVLRPHLAPTLPLPALLEDPPSAPTLQVLHELPELGKAGQVGLAWPGLGWDNVHTRRIFILLLK